MTPYLCFYPHFYHTKHLSSSFCPTLCPRKLSPRTAHLGHQASWPPTGQQRAQGKMGKRREDNHDSILSSFFRLCFLAMAGLLPGHSCQQPAGFCGHPHRAPAHPSPLLFRPRGSNNTPLLLASGVLLDLDYSLTSLKATLYFLQAIWIETYF